MALGQAVGEAVVRLLGGPDWLGLKLVTLAQLYGNVREWRRLVAVEQAAKVPGWKP